MTVRDETLLGVDVGGTFTDFVLVTGEGVRTWKRPSTPSAPEDAFLSGLPKGWMGRTVHGSTVATNALLERHGPRTFLLTTAGFKDVLQIRRQARPALYELEPHRSDHVILRGDSIGVNERLAADGSVVVALTEFELSRVVAAARDSEGEAFAISFLFSYLNPAHEHQVADAMRSAGLEVCASSEVSPEHREYERGSTTAINAFLRPVVRRYVSSLETKIGPQLRVMHSAGGLTSPTAAVERPVSMVLSGPAGGVIGAAAVARQAGFERIISFDMGGTSTDVSLVDREVAYRSLAEIDGLAIQAPMVDVVTVGAGGGSIARLDEGGALRVGPESAGADPGPACYGVGTKPTVSDADLVLGRLRAEQPLGGTLHVDLERASTAMAPLADSPERAAASVVAVVDANTARAVRRVSLERGFDPADFTLVAFGGAGPLHACGVADAVGVGRVLVPRFPGVLSALGMLTAPEAVERSRGLIAQVGGDDELLRTTMLELESEGRDAFGELSHGADYQVQFFADLRYQGQAHELRVSVEKPHAPSITDAFHQAHDRRFGFSSPHRVVDMVALRVRVSSPGTGLPGWEGSVQSPVPAAEVEVWSPEASVVVRASLRHRDCIGEGESFDGPAVVAQEDATAFVPAAWKARCDMHGNLVLERI